MTCCPGSVVDIEGLDALIAMTLHQQLPILAKLHPLNGNMTGSRRGDSMLCFGSTLRS